MKIGRFTLSVASLALLIVQLAIVSTIAAKYLYQRWSCPRVWTRAAAYDPEMPMRGRYLALRLTVDGCQSTLPSAKDAAFPHKYDGTTRPGPYTLRQDTSEFRANLNVVNNTLVAVRLEGQEFAGHEDSNAGQEVVGSGRGTLRPDAARRRHRLLRLRHRAKPSAAQARPGALDRGDRSAQGPAAPAATGAQRQWELEAAGAEISVGAPRSDLGQNRRPIGNTVRDESALELPERLKTNA